MCYVSSDMVEVEWGLQDPKPTEDQQGSNGINKYNFIPCDFCKINGISESDDFLKPFARHNYTPMESI